MSSRKQKIIRTDDVLEVLDFYEKNHKAVASDRTMYAVKALTGFFDGYKTGDIDVPMCHQYIAFRMTNDVSMSTAARELNVLRAATNHALKWKVINNEQRATFEIPTDLPKCNVWLFKDEIQKLISNSTSYEVALFIRIAYGTGSRRKAIEKLEWNQCDMVRRTINLSKHGEQETNKRRPTVPMADLFPLFEKLHPLKKNQWVLGSDRDLLYEFEKTCKRADLLHTKERDGRPSGKTTPHVLRHSRATHLLEDGASIYAVAKLLGDTPVTVQKTYGHIAISSLEGELFKSKLST